MSEHTSEPWKVNDQTASGIMDNSFYICDEYGHNLVRVYNDYGNQAANARRIVAAVNACKDVATDDLISGAVMICGSNLISYFDSLKQKREEMLTAIKVIRTWAGCPRYIKKDYDDIIAKADSIIASVEASK